MNTHKMGKLGMHEDLMNDEALKVLSVKEAGLHKYFSSC